MQSYFITDPVLERALRGAVKRGVKVTIMTNSSETLDDSTFFARTFFVMHGARIIERGTVATPGSAQPEWAKSIDWEKIRLTRFHGILAPHSQWRSLVVPQKPEEKTEDHIGESY